MCIDFVSKAKYLFAGINIYQSSEGVWAFTDARAVIQQFLPPKELIFCAAMGQRSRLWATW
ncbi:hypothetical protein D9M73_264840 [compost metagenome]